MANGFGLRLVGRIGGGEPRVREYYVPATNAVALAEGDVVELPTTGALDPAGQVQVVVAFASGSVPLGVVQGIRPIAALPYTTGLPVSTAAYIEVCDDADAIYEVQEDAVGGDVAATAIGNMANANLIITTPVLGASSSMLQSSSVSTSATKDVKIIGVRRDAQNAQGISGGAILLVRLLGTALSAVTSHS